MKSGKVGGVIRVWRRVAVIAGCWALVFVVGAAADEKLSERHEVDEIVVTATRTERATEEIPAAASAVTEEDLAALRLFGIREALTGLPGVQAETRNGGYDARLIIRGAGLKARYGVREIMVLLDGVPITDPDGMTRLDFVDTQLVERVDVVRGPNSTLYGANAAGGVINVITRDPFEEVKSLKVGFGSENSQLYSLIYGTSVGSTYCTLSGTHKQTEGWREWNEFRTSQGNLKVGHLFAGGSTLEFGFGYTEADLQLPGTLTREEFKEDSSQLTSDPFRHSGRYSEIWTASLKGEREFGALKLKPLLYLQSWDHFHPVTGLINDGGADVIGADLQGDWQHELFGIEGVLTAGMTGQLDRGDGDKYTYGDVATEFVAFPAPGFERLLFTRSDDKGELAEENEDEISKWGVYLQESLRPSQRWLVDLGLRYDQVDFDLESKVFREFVYGANRYVELAEPQRIKVDRSFDQISPRIGAVYKAGEWINLYGNVATGFQTPQGSELEDNRDLDPATTVSYEAGIKARHPAGHQADLAFFYATVEDEIVLSRLDDGETAYSNAGKTKKYGVEFAGELELRPGLQLGGSYTWSDFEFDTFDEPVRVFNPVTRQTEVLVFDRGGNQLPYIPEHQYSLYGRYRHPAGFKMQLDASSWGDYYVDNANSEKYTGYDFLTNLMVGWEGERWDFTVDVSNLFDKHYAMEVTKEGDELRYRPGAPQTWFARATYRF